VVVAPVDEVGEKDSQMCAPELPADTGRWIIAYRFPKRRGNRAASLSSGGMTGPSRSNEVKSLVRASDTSGPLGEKAV
jgi:hypothetical protein